MSTTTDDGTFLGRIGRIASEITLADLDGMRFSVKIGREEGLFDKYGDPAGRFYFQIECYRRDVITGEMGPGYSGKKELSPFMTDNELVQIIFGLYKGYWEHEARETFMWRGRRIFGPHIAVEALYGAAIHVDVRSAKHVEDTPVEEVPQNRVDHLTEPGPVENGGVPLTHMDTDVPAMRVATPLQDVVRRWVAREQS